MAARTKLLPNSHIGPGDLRQWDSISSEPATEKICRAEMGYHLSYVWQFTKSLTFISRICKGRATSESSQPFRRGSQRVIR
jgi:hypothetical protein